MASNTGRGVKRSARQCLERWQELAHNDLALSKDVKQNDREWKEIETAQGSVEELLWERHENGKIGNFVDDSESSDSVAEGEGNSDVNHMEGVEKTGSDADDSTTTDSSTTKKRLEIVRKALSNRRKPPGIPGTEPTQKAPVHTSHNTASNQAADALTDVGVKQEVAQHGELWPLQLLEAYKLKASMAAKAPPPTQSKNISGRSTPSSSSKGVNAREVSMGRVEVIATVFPVLTSEQLTTSNEVQDRVNSKAGQIAAALSSNPDQAFLQEVERKKYEQEVQVYNRKKRDYEEALRLQALSASASKK